MKTETIEKLLREAGIAEEKIKAVVDGVMAENGKDIEAEKIKTTGKETELVSANTTVKELEEKIKAFDGVDIKKMQEEARLAVEKHNTEKAELESQLRKQKVDTAVDLALATAKAKNSKAVKALLDIDSEKTEFNEDGTVKGLSEQVKKLLESEDSKFLFETEKNPTFKGFKLGEGRDKGAGEEQPKTLKDAVALAFSGDSE